MTALPDHGDTSGRSDAELAGAAAAGDRSAFAAIYDRYADRLFDFCVGMLRDRDGAADCVQDAFCIAVTRLSQLREPDKLRPWLYAIARNEALRRLRERRRETPSAEMPETLSEDPGPDALAARSELTDLIAEASGGLSDRDRSVLELTYRHGLDGPELADALGVTPANANKMLSRLRKTFELSLGALLVSRRVFNKPDECPALAGILDDWDGRFSVLMRKRVARHIESCPTCDEHRQRLVSPAGLLAGAPVFIPAPSWLRERTLSDVRLEAVAPPIDVVTVAEHAGGASGAGNDAPPGPTGGGRRRSVIVVAALFFAALIASVGLTLVWSQHHGVSIFPTEVGDTVPAGPSGVPKSGYYPSSSTDTPTTVAETTTPGAVRSPDPVTTPAPPPPPPVVEPTPAATMTVAPPVPPPLQPSIPPPATEPPSVRTSEPPPETTAERTPTTTAARTSSRTQPNTGSRTSGGSNSGGSSGGGDSGSRSSGSSGSGSRG
ncbi:RNA polymerase sigma factor [Mycolicibacterium xanthum]|uniref:RNA polymerase sigma factor n=1 Tax=Mycolicibacterium xanthum TaxID=2796469 RepID=UPI00210721BD|nr:sigma-70 family RNA polymerase sigma factor [Mycolicibacterium xanthum]